MDYICFYTDTDKTNMMIKFISLKMLETLKKHNLWVDIRASRLQSGNGAYDDLVDSLEHIFDLLTPRVNGMFMDGAK